MTPSEILATVKSLADAITAYFTWLQTPEGKTFSQQAMKDRTAWDTFWKDAGVNIGKFFRGEYFK